MINGYSTIRRAPRKMQLSIVGDRVEILIRVGVSGQGADIRVKLSELLTEIVRQLPAKPKRKISIPLELSTLLSAAAAGISE